MRHGYSLRGGGPGVEEATFGETSFIVVASPPSLSIFSIFCCVGPAGQLIGGTLFISYFFCIFSSFDSHCKIVRWRYVSPLIRFAEEGIIRTGLERVANVGSRLNSQF